MLDSIRVVSARFRLHVADVAGNPYTFHLDRIVAIAIAIAIAIAVAVAVGGGCARGDVPNFDIHHRA